MQIELKRIAEAAKGDYMNNGTSNYSRPKNGKILPFLYFFFRAAQFSKYSKHFDIQLLISYSADSLNYTIFRILEPIVQLK